jgi:hypothetical protein
MHWKHPSSPVAKNSRCNHWQESWCWPSSGILQGLFLRPTWNAEQLLPIVTCFRESWSLQSALRKREIVRRHHVVAWQCPSSYRSQNIGNPQETEVGSQEISISQSRFCAIWFSPFWTT